MSILSVTEIITDKRTIEEFENEKLKFVKMQIISKNSEQKIVIKNFDNKECTVLVSYEIYRKSEINDYVYILINQKNKLLKKYTPYLVKDCILNEKFITEKEVVDD